MWNENSIKTCQDSVLHHTARLLCPTKNGNFSEFLLPRNSFLCISLAMPSEEFSKYILNRSTGSTAVNKCWFLTRKWLVLRPWLVKANAFFIFINGTSPNLVQKHLITWIYPPPTWDSWHVPGGFPQQFKQKIHGPLHDSATTVCVHLVHIHREFFLSISYDLTQGHRQNAKTHLFQRQNSSPIHSEESLFEKKKKWHQKVQPLEPLEPLQPDPNLQPFSFIPFQPLHQPSHFFFKKLLDQPPPKISTFQAFQQLQQQI